MFVIIKKKTATSEKKNSAELRVKAISKLFKDFPMLPKQLVSFRFSDLLLEVLFFDKKVSLFNNSNTRFFLLKTFVVRRCC